MGRLSTGWSRSVTTNTGIKVRSKGMRRSRLSLEGSNAASRNRPFVKRPPRAT